MMFIKGKKINFYFARKIKKNLIEKEIFNQDDISNKI